MSSEEIKVKRHPSGWAVVRQLIGGHLHGMTTVLAIHKTKAAAERAVYAHK